jgi:hypothetical protein
MEWIKVTFPDGSTANLPAKRMQAKLVPKDHPDWTFSRLSRWYAFRRHEHD